VETALGAAPKAMRRGAGAEARSLAVIAALLVLLIASVLCSIAVGAVRVPIRTLAAALVLQHTLSEEQRVILFAIRLPRILASAFVGAALSTAGLLFQGLFRNPLADPYVIGSSGGAVLGASAGLFLLPPVSMLGFSATALMAFAGSSLTVVLVYWLARVDGQTPVATLLLAGFAVSTMLSYSSYFVEVLDQDYGLGLRVLASWLQGMIGIPRWTQLGVIGAMIALAFAFSFPLARRLNTLALGDDYARQLGLQVESVRIGVIAAASLLTASAVALGGLISFVGMIVPHFARLIAGPDHVRLLPVTALAGALFLVVADTLARTILAPSEVPVGVLMAFLGGPFFLYLLRRSKQGAGAKRAGA
jgi:iron complex transport system permease protein